MSNSTGSFSAPPQILTFDGLLSDFDGTIVDSTDAIVKHWHRIGAELGVDPATILATSHGRRSIDTLQLYDPTKANWEYVSYVEGRIPQEYGSDAVEIPGARSLLSALDEAGARWGVVTSGTRALLEGWLGVLNLTHPDVLVVAEDVELGKPDPRCYLLGRTRLGLEHSPALVVLEDAPSGIKAGKAAGFTVIALTTTHTLEQLQAAGADVIIEDLRSISVKSVVDGRIELEVRNAFQ
ncbi:HAD-like protein [Aspergillus uvarum CBS 121591]|uniref:HAD-like protein n=1 Tax=Aspergillus uvarum CBS 121591 TaxID=1448315 RepID=A0A319CP93_9EURO|nr:HAD-like protein [Aspergillus uvarum CBS 121591]PYH87266.1 HAD-like protein [Aspergillus uvarum CBS 121591]